MNTKQIIDVLLSREQEISGKFHNAILEIIRLGYESDRGKQEVKSLVESIEYSLEDMQRILENLVSMDSNTKVVDEKQQKIGNMELLYDLIKNKYKQVNGLGFVLELTNRTQKEVADILGIKHQNVYKWVAGVQAVSKRHLPKLENILGVPKEYLVKELSVEDKVEILKMFYNKDKEISF